MASPWDALAGATAISGTDEPTTSEPVLQMLHRYLQGGGVARVPITESAMGIAGSTKLANVAPQIADPGVVARALRAMGREAMNYMRKTGQKVDVTPLNTPGASGLFIPGKEKHLAMLAPNAPEAAAFHELTGHMFEESLPNLTKQRLQEAQKTIPSTTRKFRLSMAGYKPEDIPGESFAFAKEQGRPGAYKISEFETRKATEASREARKSLKEIMRQAFEGGEEVTEQAVPAMRKRVTETPISPDELQNLLGSMGPKVDPNAEVFTKNAEFLKPLLEAIGKGQ